jgi:hypothetical protein
LVQIELIRQDALSSENRMTPASGNCTSRVSVTFPSMVEAREVTVMATRSLALNS